MIDGGHRTRTVPAMKTHGWMVACVLVVLGWPFLMCFRLYEVPTHELGHYVACVVQGNGPAHMHLLSSPPITTCKHVNAAGMVAGIVSALLFWAVFTALFARWVRNWLATKHPVAFLCLSVFWFVWSFLAIGELYAWARDIHSTKVPTPDVVQFIATTQVDAQSVRVVCLGLIPVFIAFGVLTSGIAIWRMWPNAWRAMTISVPLAIEG
jgi:hypothetical protein